MALKSRSEFVRFSVFLMAVVLGLSACVATPDQDHVGMNEEQPDYSDSAYSGVSQTLEQFGSDAAYLTYLDQRDRRPSAWWYYRRLR